MAVDTARPVVLGKISGVYGVRGWVKVFSYTKPRENILEYSPWLLGQNGQWSAREVLDGRPHGKGIVVRLAGCDDRDQAFELIDSDIAVPRSQLPPPGEGEVYWADLLGLRVENLQGVSLGTVVDLFETGANDVLVVQAERERLIPLVQPDFVRQIDLQAGLLLVDWDPEF